MKKIMILLVLMMIHCVDAKVMKRVQNIQPAPVIKPPVPAPTPIPVLTPVSEMKIDQDAIKNRLDEQLRSPVESAWNDRINDVFDLAIVNRELAREYFIKMREKMVEAGVKPVELIERTFTKPIEEKKSVEEKVAEPSLPAGEKPMKRGTGIKAPPSRKLGQKPETKKGEEIVAGEEMKKEITKPKAKEVVSKVAEQVFTRVQLEKLKDSELLGLFNDLLEKLSMDPRNWNGMAIETKSTGGGMLYGAPQQDWMNKVDIVRDVLDAKRIKDENGKFVETKNKEGKTVIVTRTIMPKEESKRIKNEQIEKVREKKNKEKPVVPTRSEEKPKEELTEDDLVKLIKALFADPKPEETSWLISIKGNIKKLDKLNHEMALKYHDQFIELASKEKPFLK